jgi:hypothetical protein
MFHLTLVHLGTAYPTYLEHCIHQLRLWNSAEELTVYVILEPCHRDKEALLGACGAEVVFTDTLPKTRDHELFLQEYAGDTEFRKGYWRHVKERFFYMEELMIQKCIGSMVSMEYDVLLYTPFSTLFPKLVRHGGDRLAFVMDNETRGHPGFLYIGSPEAIMQFNQHILMRIKVPLEDMKLLCDYWQNYPERVKFLPAISHERNKAIPNRTSRDGQTTKDPFFLSDGFESLESLFDSAVVGQALGGIDPRNTHGTKIVGYENEGALYSMIEMPFEWKQEGGLWKPYLDMSPLNTIHVHSKALQCFLSDRATTPSGDYSVGDIHKALVLNDLGL